MRSWKTNKKIKLFGWGTGRWWQKPQVFIGFWSHLFKKQLFFKLFGWGTDRLWQEAFGFICLWSQIFKLRFFQMFLGASTGATDVTPLHWFLYKSVRNPTAKSCLGEIKQKQRQHVCPQLSLTAAIFLSVVFIIWFLLMANQDINRYNPLHMSNNFSAFTCMRSCLTITSLLVRVRVFCVCCIGCVCFCVALALTLPYDEMEMLRGPGAKDKSLRCRASAQPSVAPPRACASHAPHWVFVVLNYVCWFCFSLVPWALALGRSDLSLGPGAKRLDWLRKKLKT